MAALKKNELVLVTGATGFIGSAVVAETLRAGLRVRATARNEEKAKQLRDGFKEQLNGDDSRLEVVIVEDMQKPGAFDEAVTGVQGVEHVASVLTFTDKWDEVVEPSKAGALVMLEAAAKAGTVRRFALTSSSCALGMPTTEKEQKWTVSTWNDGSVEEAKVKPNGWNIYAASKTIAERAAWEFVEKNKPGFKLTTVNPNMNFGKIEKAASTKSTGGWVTNLVDGNDQVLQNVTPQHFINVTDVARLHVAAMTREDVGSERLLGFTEAVAWGDLVKLVQRIKPDSAAKGLDPNRKGYDAKDKTVIDATRMHEVLGKGNVADLETSVKQALGVEDVHPFPQHLLAQA